MTRGANRKTRGPGRRLLEIGKDLLIAALVLVNLTLSGYGDVSVALDYFSQVEGLCSMSINVLKNETLTVTEAVGGYKLTARRFGHGVGMSQRGAQQMANEGFAYDQILEFYYPGLTRTRYTMTRTLLDSMDGPPRPAPRTSRLRTRSPPW